MTVTSVPLFDELPVDKKGPFLNAWGLYGDDDELGFLNRLTDELVKEAAKEIHFGTRISLNWPMDAQNDIPFFGRQVFHKHVYQKPPRVVNDDVWTFNTQRDGLRHFAYQKEAKFYNGVTLDDIHSENSTINGIGAWSEKGIIGRGILLDYEAWREEHGHPLKDAFKTGAITLSELKAVAEWEGVEMKFGDILIIRSGYMVQYYKSSHDDLKALSKILPPTFLGVEQSEEVLRWIWENFSAVAGDQPSFECWPSSQPYMLHEVLLAGWGCPIGELFDLEALSVQCKKSNRTTKKSTKVSQYSAAAHAASNQCCSPLEPCRDMHARASGRYRVSSPHVFAVVDRGGETTVGMHEILVLRQVGASY
ncbi:hypothetical protein E4T45_10038 [Aureobasidium sp. EXF-8846]|nr:hypothetical protein E4T45_10038 [Aureobasidium sp. EXF-8846]